MSEQTVAVQSAAAECTVALAICMSPCSKVGRSLKRNLVDLTPLIYREGGVGQSLHTCFHPLERMEFQLWLWDST